MRITQHRRQEEGKPNRRGAPHRAPALTDTFTDAREKWIFPFASRRDGGGPETARRNRSDSVALLSFRSTPGICPLQIHSSQQAVAGSKRAWTWSDQTNPVAINCQIRKQPRERVEKEPRRATHEVAAIVHPRSRSASPFLSLSPARSKKKKKRGHTAATKQEESSSLPGKVTRGGVSSP